MSGTREENIFMARLAEQAERYGDMVHYMANVAKMGDLNSDERSLFSVAYKQSVNAVRQAWRVVNQWYKIERDTRPAVAELYQAYEETVKSELKEKCEEVLVILQTFLLPHASGESWVFYAKMQGDYFRYVAEFSRGEELKMNSDNALRSYSTAMEQAKQSLPPTHAIRLGLALNFSVFYYEVINSAETACDIASTALEDAKAGPPEALQDPAIAQIICLLRDNLITWRTAMQGPTEDGKPPEQDGTAVEDF